MINTVIVEDNAMMQEHLKEMLIKAGKFSIAAVLSDAFLAEKECGRGGVNLVLMDVQTLHNHSGLAAGEHIKKVCPNTKVIVVTSLVDPEIIARAKRGAADSLWYKDHSSSDLMDVICRTMAGESVFPDSSPSVELKDMFSGDISPRQLSILRRFVLGMTYEEIADELKITKDGVRWNINQLIEKGGFQNKYELLIALVEKKLIVTSLTDSDDE